MNKKPVHMVDAKSVLNMDSGFKHKLLCDGPTFSLGTACAYSCTFCYVPDAMRKSPHLVAKGGAPRFPEKHEDMVIRRRNALELLRAALVDKQGKDRFPDPTDRRVIYASPLVDVAANLELATETVDACRVILQHTAWQIRLLSKSHLLPMVAKMLEETPSLRARERVIYGVSTGTLDDRLAACFELGTARVTKRIESLHWLQDNGYRTFGMICPSLPQQDYRRFAREMQRSLRSHQCEHVYAEVINVRGDSMSKTVDALATAGYLQEADALRCVSTDRIEWERYARDTFEAHADFHGGMKGPDGMPKLRFLQYVTKATRPYWEPQAARGAVLL